MGVSGSGKTSIGQLLSDKTRIPFLDADDFHPIANIKKMKEGIALVDEDRIPWLEILSAKLADFAKQKGAILACSALKESYREILASKTEGVVNWVFLNGSKELILQRISGRKDHFMPETLLNSQFGTLETPSYCIVIDINQTPERMVDQIINSLDHA